MSSLATAVCNLRGLGEKEVPWGPAFFFFTRPGVSAVILPRSVEVVVEKVILLDRLFLWPGSWWWEREKERKPLKAVRKNGKRENQPCPRGRGSEEKGVGSLVMIAEMGTVESL